MSDDLVATLEALGEDDFYCFPATTKAAIDRAVAEIDRLRPRIAELEAALRDVLPYVDTCNSSHREAQAKGYAALAGGKDE